MNPDETTVVETETQTEITPEEVIVVEETTADPIDAVEDIDELRRIAKTHRSVAQRYKKDAKQPKPQITNKAEPKPYNILEDEVADLILDGYTKDETKFILSNGGRKALENKDSYVAIAINTKRQQRKTEEAVGQTSNKGYVSSGGKTYTEEQLKNMTPEEMEKVLPHA